MKYVIIGNSAAAVGCIEGIRKVDTKGEITVISDEVHHTYSRPLISYYLLGKVTRETMRYRDENFYKDNNVTALLGEKAVKIDKKEVTLESGKTVSFDKLLIATGSSPFVPPMKGLDSVENKFSFMKFDDALALENVLTPASKVLIVGAGLIGLKCAEGIGRITKDITVVDLADRILSSILDEEGAALMQKHLEEDGMKFHLSDCVETFDNSVAHLKSGKEVVFDVLVLAVGVRPNTELAQNAGAAVEKGIVTDETQKTTLDNVYAAGDCVLTEDVTFGGKRILALLPNAYMQGEVAGINMAGGKAEFTNGAPMNAIGFNGYHILTAGTYTGEAITEKDGENYKKLFVKDDLLKGFILMGNVARGGIYTNIMKKKIPLSSLDSSILGTPNLSAFSESERRRMLGSLV
mgnify:CR=1 FL=1